MRVLLAQLRGLGAPGERERAQRADDVEVVQPMGLRVRPAITSSLEAVVVETPSGERIAVVLVDKARAAGAVEAEIGETQLHGLAEQSAVIRIRASGDIELTPKSGRNLILAGGSTAVAKEGSVTTGHAHGGTLTGTITGTSATGGPVTGSCTITIPSDTDTIATNAGSPRVRVP
jgi:hypothetical protein